MQLKDASFDDLVHLEAAGQLVEEITAILPPTETYEGTPKADVR